MASLPTTALILAAGRGERMRPLSDTTPKPLLQVRGKALIEYHLEALARAGVERVVVNTAHLWQQFEPLLGIHGNISRWGMRLYYSHEGRDCGHALETAGGMARAMRLRMPADQGGESVLGDRFYAVAGDIYAPELDYKRLAENAVAARTVMAGGASKYAASGAPTPSVQPKPLAHLAFIPNPPHHPQGDFALDAQGRVHLAQTASSLPVASQAPPLAVANQGNVAAPKLATYTYAAIGIYSRAFFEAHGADLLAAQPVPPKPLRPLLNRAAAAGHLSGEVLTHPWTDVGTPERLAQLNSR